jgi:hypothetical protein
MCIYEEIKEYNCENIVCYSDLEVVEKYRNSAI